MDRLGTYIPGFDELTPDEQTELTEGLKKPENHSLVGQSIPGFNELQPDEQSELVGLLTDGENAFQTKGRQQEQLVAEMDQANQEAQGGIVDRMTQPLAAVPRGMAGMASGIQETVGEAARAGGRALGIQSIEDYGKAFADQARTAKEGVNEAFSTPLADRSFSDTVKKGDVVGAGLKVAEAGLGLVPFVAGAQVAGPVAAMAVQAVPETIKTMEDVTGRYDLGVAATGAAVGGLESVIFGKLLGKLSGEKTPAALAEESTALTMDLLKRGTLSRIGAIIKDAVGGGVKEAAKFAPAAAAVETLKYEAEKILQGQHPDMSPEMKKRVLSAVIESIPMGLAAGGYAGAEPRIRMGRSIEFRPDAAAKIERDAGKTVAEAAPEWGPNEANPETQPNIHRAVAEAAKSMDKIIEIPKTAAIDIAADAQADPPMPGQAVQIQMGGKSGFLVAPDTTDPNAPVYFSLGTETGTRVAKVMKTDGAVQGIKKAIAEGMISPEVQDVFNLIEKQHPELDIGTKVMVADHFLKLSEEFGGDPSTYVGGRTDQPGPGKSTLISLFATDPITREVAGQDAIHEIYHHAYRNLDPSLREGFMGWARGRGYNTDEDAAELYAQIGEAWHLGRLPSKDAPPSWLKQGWNEAKAKVSQAYKLMAGIKGVTVPDNVAKVIGAKEIPGEVSEALDAPLSKPIDSKVGSDYIQGEPFGTTTQIPGQPGAMTVEPSYIPAGSVTEETPGNPRQVTVRAPNGSVFSTIAPGSESLVPPSPEHSLHNIDTWKDDARRWMKENGIPDAEIMRKMASIDGQLKIMQQIVGEDNLEYFPTSANAVAEMEEATGKKVGKMSWQIKGSGKTGKDAGPIRGNSDPLYVVSFDLSSECVRRRDYQATVMAILEKTGKPLTDNQALALTAMFREEGELAPCLYCFVEAPRRKMSELLNKWQRVFNGELKAPEKDAADVKALMDSGITGKNIDYSVFLSGTSLNDLPPEHPFRSNPEFFKFIRKKVSSQVNQIKSYEEYSGQILDIDQNLVDYLKLRAGLRFFSSSDFQPEHVVDLMQAISDAETRGLPAHSYTKISDLAEIFAKTRMKINTSLFSHGMGKDGVPVPDEWQGMAWKKAFDLRRKNPDCGTVLVATSDDMIRWALGSGDIDYIIPFHHSGVSKQVIKSSRMQDYTNTQHELLLRPIDWQTEKNGALTAKRGDLSFKITENDAGKFVLTTTRSSGEVELLNVEMEESVDQSGKKKTVESVMKAAEKLLTTVRSNDYLDLANGTDNKTAKENYLKICEARGVEPVFPKFVDHENYIKLKKDFARTDTPFKPVTAKFDTKKAAEVTRRYVEAQKNPEGASVLDGRNGVVNQKILRRFHQMFPKGAPGVGNEAQKILLHTNRRIGKELGVREFQDLDGKGKPAHALRRIDQHATDEARNLAGKPNATPMDRVLARMSIKEQSEKPKSSWYSDWVDDLDGLREAVREMSGTQVILADQNPETLARLFRGAYGKADTFLRGGTFTWTDPSRTGEPLQAILADVGKVAPAESGKNSIDEFRAFLGARRAHELQGRGLGSGINIQDAARTMAQLAPKYSAMADRLYRFQDSILRYARDSRVVSQEQYLRMKAANQYYIPFFRVREPLPGQPGGPGGKSLELVSDPIKELKGDDKLRIIDPLESVVKNAYTLIPAAEKNHVGRMLVDLANQAGATHLVQLDPTVRDTGRTRPGYIKVITDGQVSHYRVSPEIETAMKALDRETAATVIKMLAKPASWLRSGSVLTPEFALRNPIRDNQASFMYSKFGFVPGYDTVRGLLNVLSSGKGGIASLAKAAGGDPEIYWKWKASGGGGSEVTAIDREYMQKSLDQIVAENGGWASLPGRLITSPMEAMRALSEMTEQMTRVGEFGAGLRKLGNSKAAMTEAAAASRDVTLDFSRAGNKGRVMNMITAFWNANIQGVDKFIRAHKENPVGTALRAAVSLTLPSAILALANADDPRYQDLPQWQKDLFWVIITDPISRTEWEALLPAEKTKKAQETIWRIPKSPGLNLLYTMPVERFIQWTAGNDPHAAREMGKRLFVDLLPGLLPTGLIPLAEGISDFSFFTGRPIEPAGSERVLPEDRTSPGNTGLAKMASRALGAVEDATGLPVRVSPPKLENTVRGLTGGIGMYALRGIDAGAKEAGRAAGIIPPGNEPAGSMADIPGVKGFVSRYPQPYGENVTRFLENYTRASQRFNSGMKRTKGGDMSGPGLMSQPEAVHLDEIKNAFGELMTAARAIEGAQNMDPQAKKDQIDEIYLTMSELAREGNLIIDGLVGGKKP
jgi:hypothetical protein